MPVEPRKRRNGQPQACESCRRSKIRCDHASPQCARCVARNLVCIYHPAPLTRHFPHARATASPTQPLGDYTAIATSLTTTRPPFAARRNSLFLKDVGPSETTRFSAVFSENQDSFGPVIHDAIDDAISDVIGDADATSVPTTVATTTTHSGHDSGEQRNAATDWPLMDLAVNTLLNFPSARTCDILLTGLPFILDVWVSPTMIQHCLRQVWKEYGDCLGTEGGQRTRESVSRIANSLFRNGKEAEAARTKTKYDPNTSFDPDGWMNWFSGPRLQWEMIGILFSWAGMAFRHKQEWDAVFSLPEQHGRNRNTAADKMRECTAACARLCEDYTEISNIMVICLKNCSKLQSIIISDESDRIRVDYGTVRSAFLTAGLHRLPPLDKVTPFSQYRASLAASMYYLDKSESLFNARPPMLFRQYCQFPLPLDLCEEDIYNGRDRMEAAVAKLDAHGWNTDGRIFTVTWVRALALLSPIREGILELSLSVDQQFTQVQVEDLISRLRQIVAAYPPHIQYQQHVDSLKSNHCSQARRTASELFIITRIRMDVLQCHFLLQRLLVSRGFSSGQQLFNIAKETMSVILSLWLNRDQMQNFNHTYDWIVISYGIPCAGILCVELLRSSNLAPPPAPASEFATPYEPVQLSRSEVVRDLTMFSSLLDWFRPTDNNKELTNKFSKVIQRIIDRVFDSFPPVQSSSSSTAPVRLSQGPQTTEDQILSIPGEDQRDPSPEGTAIDDIDWFNIVDWTQGNWLEQGNQTTLC